MNTVVVRTTVRVESIERTFNNRCNVCLVAHGTNMAHEARIELLDQACECWSMDQEYAVVIGPEEAS